MEGITASDGALFAEVTAVLALTTCPFATLGAGLRRGLLATMPLRQFAPGEHLIRQGQPDDHLLVIVSGTAEASIQHGASPHAIVGKFGPGDVVGEISLLTGETRTADVVARTAVRSLVLAVADFNKVADVHPEVRMLLTNVVADRLGRTTYDGLGGKDIHGYRIERCIGRGGMGIVYEATRLATGEPVAVKMMNHALLYHLGAVRRFNREADTLASMRHDSIARLHETFFAYGTYFLVMELCDGLTLRELIYARRPVDERLVRKIVGQLAVALRYIHLRGLVHRDLKPSNVIVTRNGVVKLLDFGLVKADLSGAGDPDATAARADTQQAPAMLTRSAAARLFHFGLPTDESVETAVDSTPVLALSGSNLFQGTPRYMAPEQFEGGRIDHRADVYALASVTYEALSGRPVSQARYLVDIRREKQQFRVPPREQIGAGITAEMHEFLVRGLDADPEQRRIDLDRLAAWADPIKLSSDDPADEAHASADPEAETVTRGRSETRSKRSKRKRT